MGKLDMMIAAQALAAETVLVTSDRGFRSGGRINDRRLEQRLKNLGAAP